MSIEQLATVDFTELADERDAWEAECAAKRLAEQLAARARREAWVIDSLEAAEAE
jgi:hypothetical protein